MKLTCRFATARAQALSWFAFLSSKRRVSAFPKLVLLCAALAGAEAFAAPDVTSQLEFLGNPFAARYTGANASARSVVRMRLFNNRIYLGHGNTGGLGPTDLWTFDLGQDAFIKDGVVFEELVDQLRVFGNRLYLNGRDSMGQGAMYRVDTAKGLQMFNIAEDGHYFDIYEFGGKIFSNVGVNTHPWPRLAISADDGATFTLPAQTIDGKNFAANSTQNGWEFMEFGGNLYLGWNRSTSSDIIDNPPFILKYTGNDAAPLAKVHWLYSDFFGDGTVALPSNFTEYNGLGIFTGLGSLCVTPNIETPQSAHKITGQPAGLPDADPFVAGTGCVAIRKANGKLYCAYNFQVSSVYWTAICETSVGLNWTELGRFSVGSRMRSFERAPNGDFYFGAWGTLTSQGEVAIPGNIYRVRAGSLVATPPVLVDASADTLSVFKTSGNNLSLRLRRAGPTASSLTVNYAVSGTAVAGADYTALSGTATIPAAAGSVDVPITVLNNPQTIGARSLIVTVTPDAAYTVATPSSITFTITDQTAAATTLPLDGLALWFKADQGVTSDVNGFVSAWADQSGRGFNASQPTAAKQPKLVTGPNNRPALQFDGANDWLNVGPIYAQAYTVAAVYANPLGGTVVNYMSYTQGNASGLDTSTPFYQNLFSGPSGVGTHRVIVTQPGHNQLYVTKSNGVDTTGTVTTSTKIITPDCEAVKIGTKDGTNSWYNGTISEIIIYNRPLSVAEQNTVDAYLSQRYVQANHAPVAVADSVTRTPGNFIDIPAPALTANDTDADGDPLTITGVGSPTPAGATVTFNGSTVRYTPPANNNANGSFTYQLSDSGGGVATGTVTVNVSNNPPTANNDAVQRQPLNDLVLPFAAVTANDTDPDLDPLTVVSVSSPLPSGATVAIEGTSIRYHPSTGFNGSDQFSYTVSDGRGFTASALVNITVPNNAPNGGTDFRTTSVDQPLVMPLDSLLANDTDPDGDAVSYTGTESRSAAGGTVRYSTSTHQVIYVPPRGFNGPDTFHYTIQDARGLSSQVTVQIAVVVSNNAPTPGADTFNRTLNKPITIQFSQLLVNDTDPDGPSDLPLSIIAVTGRTAAGAKIVLSPSSLTYTAPPGYNGNDTFTYTVKDNRGAMASATVTILTGAASKAPLAPSIGPDVYLSANVIENGVIALRAVTVPGTVLQIDAADSPTGEWTAFGQIRTGQNGVAYIEQKPSGTGQFFKASIINQ